MEKFRSTVENECFVGIFLFLIQVLKLLIGNF